MVRTENEVVKPINPAFYKRFAGDIYSRKNKFQQDVLFGALNNFYTSIKLTIVVNPGKFLDTTLFKSYNGKKDFTLFVNHFTARSYLSPVN